jgi:hypothetical protein
MGGPLGPEYPMFEDRSEGSTLRSSNDQFQRVQAKAHGEAVPLQLLRFHTGLSCTSSKLNHGLGATTLPLDRQFPPED